MIEMLVYSRPGHVELLPALPGAWAASGSRHRCRRTRRLRRGSPTGSDGTADRARITSVGGRTTTVSWRGSSRRSRCGRGSPSPCATWVRPRRWAVLLGPALALALCTPGQASPVPAASPVPSPRRYRLPRTHRWSPGRERRPDGRRRADRSHRLVVRTSAGGPRTRIRLSNAFGDRPVTFGRAYAGVRQHGPRLVPGSNRRLTFGGDRSVTRRRRGDRAQRSAARAAARPRAIWRSACTCRTRAAPRPATAWPCRRRTPPRATTRPSRAPTPWTRTDRLLALPRRRHRAGGARRRCRRRPRRLHHRRLAVHRRPEPPLARLSRPAASGRPTDTGAKGVANEGISGNKVLADGAGQSALNRLHRDVLSQPGRADRLPLRGRQRHQGPHRCHGRRT